MRMAQVSVVGRSYWDGHSFSVSLALQEHMGTAEAHNERLGRNTPNHRSAEGKHETQGPGVQQPSETAPGRASGAQDGERVRDLVQPRRSRSKS